MTVDGERLRADAQRLHLRGAIDVYLAHGYLLEHQTDVSATLVRPRTHASPLLAFLSPLLFLLADSGNRDHRIYLAVTGDGRLLIDDGRTTARSVRPVLVLASIGAVLLGWGLGNVILGNGLQWILVAGTGALFAVASLRALVALRRASQQRDPG